MKKKEYLSRSSIALKYREQQIAIAGLIGFVIAIFIYAKAIGYLIETAKESKEKEIKVSYVSTQELHYLIKNKPITDSFKQAEIVEKLRRCYLKSMQVVC